MYDWSAFRRGEDTSMKKTWTKTLIAGSLAAGLTLVPTTAFASDNPPPEAPEEVPEEQDYKRYQDFVQFLEILGWIGLSITSDMVFGEGSMNEAAGQDGDQGNSSNGNQNGPGGGPAQEQR